MARAESLTRIRPHTIGRIEGIALVYDVVDAHGTAFAPGSLAGVKRDALPAGRVRFFLDHGDSAASNFYRTRLHIGTVRSLVTGTLADGRKAEYMVADVFDTPAGRDALDYAEAVLDNETITGLSVGFRSLEEAPATIEGRKVYLFTRIDMLEISLTAMQSVPGALVTGVTRGQVVEQLASAAERLKAVRQSFRNTAVASMTERRRAAGLAA